MEFDDPQILIGLSWSGPRWKGQARVRNDLGLSFGAAFDLSGLSSQPVEGLTCDSVLYLALLDCYNLNPQSGGPSDEGLKLKYRLTVESATAHDEF